MDTALKKRHESPPRASHRLSRLLLWFIAADVAYRQARILAEMPPERLRDMGISAEEAKAVAWWPPLFGKKA
ncbi:hypothetical protein OEW28_16605 [Defluviimonas sp. WL0002]|uniref:DUF1127 domain-containing protein n=1 Tax=Albidovulum marisflavi TaxID=2984159 RepID=A0ABT2ZGU5_9RHOB|nr:DUF1127 domain-containing protein [Defluviimonas sp. WL0002]MCV2870247.1 hypothetical protein [Defluviimonas sp. WL0002]